MSGSGQEALPDDRVWPGHPPGYMGVVRRLSLICSSGQESLPDVQECSGGWEVSENPPGCPCSPAGYEVMVGRPYWMSVSGRETFPNVREALQDVRDS